MKYLKKIEKYPLTKQIDKLRQRLNASKDMNEIVMLKRIIRDKTKQLEFPLQIDTAQGLIQRLELLVLDDDKAREAYALYQEIRDNYYNNLTDKDLVRLQKLFTIIEEKAPIQGSKISVSPGQNISALLTRLQFLITDGSYLEARKLANLLRDKFFLNMKRQEAERFNKYLGDLRNHEDLETKVNRLEEKNGMAEQQLEQYENKIEDLAGRVAQLEPLAQNALYFKKLACIILAYSFKIDPESVLSHKYLSLCLQEDKGKATYGYNETLIGNIFDTIWNNFDTVIAQYNQLLQD